MTIASSAPFKPYPAYKDSGVEWLREIPADWGVRRLKTLISEPITDGPHETPEFLFDGIPFLSVDGIQEGELVFDGCRCIGRTSSSSTGTRSFDIVALSRVEVVVKIGVVFRR